MGKNFTMPNIEMDTMGGEYFWDKVVGIDGGYCVQRHKLFGNYRLIDVYDRRLAWGTKESVQNYINDNILLEAQAIKRGDIIAVDRKTAGIRFYQHFAVYIGDYKVIHFDTNKEGDLFGKFNATIHEASFDEFIKDSEDFYVLKFDCYSNGTVWQRRGKVFFEEGKNSSTNVYPDYYCIGLGSKQMGFINSEFKEILEMIYKIDGVSVQIYSPEETVRRAKSKIGKGVYDVMMNNCEHFAIWCKTGIHESRQVDRLFGIDYWKDAIRV